MYIINGGLAITISKLELQLRYDNSCYHGIITVNDTIIVRTGGISVIPGTGTEFLSDVLNGAHLNKVRDRVLYKVISCIEYSDLKCISADEFAEVFQNIIIKYVEDYI